MSTTEQNAALDIATLPLADGRFVAIPLLALAEVLQLPDLEEGDKTMGTIHWRGYDLPIGSLDEFCGLPGQPRDKHITVGILRAGQDAKQQFRALAFCGLAAHQRVRAAELQSVEPPEQGNFTAAAEMGGRTFLVPDLPGLLYNS